jgi:putative transposase
MSEPDQIPAARRRHHPIHQPLLEQANRAVIVFVTVCTKDRQPLLSNNLVHQAMCGAWTKADHWLVGRYVIMPDHLHLFCAPGCLPMKPITNWVRYWKALVSKIAGAAEGTFWQPDFWDTQLRRHESYSTKWDYVRNNPVRASLAVKPEDWPYQGELHILRWHE